MQASNAIQPESIGVMRLEHTVLQSNMTQFNGVLQDLHEAQQGAAPEGVERQERSFSLMCELNELRDLPHHSRRAARNACIQVTSWNLPFHLGRDAGLVLQHRSRDKVGINYNAQSPVMLSAVIS